MKFILKVIFTIIPIVLHGQHRGLENVHILNLDQLFTPRIGTFVLYNVNENIFSVYNIDQAEEYFPAHSTVKILCSIAALEEKVVNEHDFVNWDSLKYKRQDWWYGEPYIHWSENQNIVSALKYSVNWYYMDLVKKMDMRKTKELFDGLNFGIIPDTLFPYYFFFSCEIYTNAFKETDFLNRLYQHKLNISSATTEIILRALIAEVTPNYKIYSKTGSGETKNGNLIGWIVGIIEKHNKNYIYALNIELPDSTTPPEIQNELHDKLKRILKMTSLDKD